MRGGGRKGSRQLAPAGRRAQRAAEPACCKRCFCRPPHRTPRLPRPLTLSPPAAPCPSARAAPALRAQVGPGPGGAVVLRPAGVACHHPQVRAPPPAFFLLSGCTLFSLGWPATPAQAGSSQAAWLAASSHPRLCLPTAAAPRQLASKRRGSESPPPRAGTSWAARGTTWRRCAARPPPSPPASTPCWCAPPPASFCLLAWPWEPWIAGGRVHYCGRAPRRRPPARNSTSTQPPACHDSPPFMPPFSPCHTDHL